jgi:hypothetical protein
MLVASSVSLCLLGACATTALGATYQVNATADDSGSGTCSPAPASCTCLVSDLRFEWRLEATGEGTLITVDVEIPDAEAHRLDSQREVISTSMQRLANLAAHE